MSLWFFKNGNFAAHWRRNFNQLVGIERIKIYLIGSIVSILENRKNVRNHSTLMGKYRVWLEKNL